jgi:hypothetical protein
VLLFESLDTANEEVFFHCDQASICCIRHSMQDDSLCSGTLRLYGSECCVVLIATLQR